MRDIKDIPEIVGAFTDWKPVKMLAVADWVKQHDRNKPDFLHELYSEGLIRQVALENMFCMNPQELTDYKKKSATYYHDEAISILVRNMGFKKPQFALLDYICKQLER
jgi:hypothetical protein